MLSKKEKGDGKQHDNEEMERDLLFTMEANHVMLKLLKQQETVG